MVVVDIVVAVGPVDILGDIHPGEDQTADYILQVVGHNPVRIARKVAAAGCTVGILHSLVAGRIVGHIEENLPGAGTAGRAEMK